MKLLIILGPTGTGKTRFSLSLLSKIDGEIISADSRQVYQNVDYLTNKISPHENLETEDIKKGDGYWIQNNVRINLYDIVSPQEQINISDYLKYATTECHRIWGEGRLPVIVGGTGFYMDTLLGKSPYSLVPPNSVRRAELKDLEIGELANILSQLDPYKFSQMPDFELKNRQRLVRYIEIAEKVGKVEAGIKYSPLRDMIINKDIEALQVGLTGNLSALYEKADRWVESLAALGHIDREIARLMEMGTDLPILNGLIFRPGVAYMKGQIDLNAMIKIMQGEVHRYIRRQMIWFRKNDRIEWHKVGETDWDRKLTEEIKKWYYDIK